MAVRMPMMATTIISSMSVKPRWLPSFFFVQKFNIAVSSSCGFVLLGPLSAASSCLDLAKCRIGARRFGLVGAGRAWGSWRREGLGIPRKALRVLQASLEQGQEPGARAGHA